MENAMKQTPLWDRNAAPTTLRRPNSEANSITPSNEEPDILKKSNLNVEAQEFVPRNIVSAPSGTSNGSVQDRLKAYQPHNVIIQDTDKDINVVTQIIGTLTRNPGQFDDLIGVLMDTLGRYLEDINFINKLVTILVNQAIADANFRYSAARICQILEGECPLFRSSLHVTCEKQLTSTTNSHGLTLFLAELYSKLNCDNLYGNCLINAIHNLLIKKSIEDYKCICQTLKLSGCVLDNYNPRAMDDVFTQLNAAKSQFPTSISNLIQSVITLRSNHWGQLSSPAVSNHSNEEFAWRSDSSDGPVYYAPDGQVMSREECDFLSNNLEEFLEDESDPDALWDPEPEMDAEVQAAFRDFVKMSKG